MATQAQMAANQANAQRSTGPTSDEGKANSRKNSTRHGLCGSMVCTSEMEQEESGKLLQDLRDEFQPQTPAEDILVYKMAELFLMNKRAGYCLALETSRNQQAEDPETQDSTRKQVALYLRYYTSADRGFNKNLADLRKMQKERLRQAGETHQSEEEERSRQPETQQNAQTSPEIGFVSQNASKAPAATPPAAPIERVSTIPGVQPAVNSVPGRQKPAA